MTHHEDRLAESGGSAPSGGTGDGDTLEGGEFTEQLTEGEGQADGISGATHGGRVAEE